MLKFDSKVNSLVKYASVLLNQSPGLQRTSPGNYRHCSTINYFSRLAGHALAVDISGSCAVCAPIQGPLLLLSGGLFKDQCLDFKALQSFDPTTSCFGDACLLALCSLFQPLAGLPAFAALHAVRGPAVVA
jgi:hypothetical protein